MYFKWVNCMVCELELNILFILKILRCEIVTLVMEENVLVLKKFKLKYLG